MSTDVTHDETLLSSRVAEEIRVWMTRRRMSGAALARALNVSTAWVSYRLTGSQEIGLNDLQRIASALEVDPMDLFPRGSDGRLISTASSQADHRTGTNARSTQPAERPTLSGQRKRAEERESSRRPARVVPFIAELMPDELSSDLLTATAA